MDKCQVINIEDLKNSNDAKNVSTERTKPIEIVSTERTIKSTPRHCSKELDELYNQSDSDYNVAHINSNKWSVTNSDDSELVKLSKILITEGRSEGSADVKSGENTTPLPPVPGVYGSGSVDTNKDDLLKLDNQLGCDTFCTYKDESSGSQLNLTIANIDFNIFDATTLDLQIFQDQILLYINTINKFNDNENLKKKLCLSGFIMKKIDKNSAAAKVSKKKKTLIITVKYI